MKLPFYKISVWIIILILIILALGVVYLSWPFPLNDGDNVVISVYFIGICRIILVTGLLLFIYLLLQKGFQLYLDEKKREIQANDWEHKENERKRLISEAEQRRDHDDKRNRIIDLFRLIELAKDKLEKVESSPPLEKLDKPFIRNIDKSEVLDLEKLKKLIEFYKEINPETLKG